MIQHHLSNTLLLSYSAGQLSEGFSLAVASHLSLCDSCRAAAGAYDALGGALLDDAAAAPVPDDLFAATLRRARADTTPPGPPPPGDDILPAPLAAYVGGGLSNVPWRAAGMGVRQAILPLSDGSAAARLLSIPAGTAVPDHSHNGMEVTLVLQGAFSDHSGTFARGDVEIATDETQHMPIADLSGDCICLAVTDAPLKFRNWLPRIAQPFLRI